MIHIAHQHETHGLIPLCGQAMWGGLTHNVYRNECWECASIAGRYSDELQRRFNINEDGSPR